jgi:hypothetical protein
MKMTDTLLISLGLKEALEAKSKIPDWGIKSIMA